MIHPDIIITTREAQDAMIAEIIAGVEKARTAFKPLTAEERRDLANEFRDGIYAGDTSMRGYRCADVAEAFFANRKALGREG